MWRHDVDEIDQDPATGGLPFDARWPDPVLAGVLEHVLGDGSGMHVPSPLKR